MSVSKVCQQCEKEFRVPSRRHETVKFCSQACKTAAGRATLSCVICSKVFERKKSSIKGKIDCCSNACRLVALAAVSKKPRGPRCIKTCKKCGNEFTVNQYRKDTARYCSKQCQHDDPAFRELMAEVQRGEKSWRWKTGVLKRGAGYLRSKRVTNGAAERVHRIVVQEAMQATCPEHPFLLRKEGAVILNPRIDVHHIDHDPRNNDPSNLLALTKSAHSRLHRSGRKPDPWECWPSDPPRW